MKLPIIKNLVKFANERDQDFLLETAETLEALSETNGLKDNELDVLGELISNIYGAVEVCEMVNNGQTEKDALNGFMKRVLGSIDN